MRKILLTVLLAVFCTFLQADEYVKGKIISLHSFHLNKGEEDEGIERIENYKVKILSGEDKGKIIVIEYPIYKERAYNIDIRKGRKVVLGKGEEEGEGYYIIDIEKRGAIFGLIFLFSVFTIFIGKKKGVKALISLSLVIFIVYKIFLPLIAKGYSPILISSFCALLSSTITIFMTTGYSTKGKIAIYGAVVGVVFAGILSMYFSRKMGLTGFDSIDIMNMAQLLDRVKMKEIVSAGVILGSMGAVMDVAISIASAMQEVIDIEPDISQKEIFKSGMRVGGDIIGSMVNTLILAYIGSGILSTLLIYLQRDQFPAIRILNFETIASDILRAFVGSIGILITVFMTSYFSSVFYKKEKRNKNSSQ